MDKPTVKYTGLANVHKDWAGVQRAILVPLDHPNPEGLVTNGEPVTTSRLVSHDEVTGRIETQNTIYIRENT